MIIKSMSENEIYFSSSKSTMLTYAANSLKGRESDFSSGYAVRVLNNKKLGFAYSQTESGIKQALIRAKTASKFSPVSSFSFAPKSEVKKVNIFDESLDSPEPKYLSEFVNQAKSGAESLGGKSRVILSTASSLTSIENSEGFSGKYKKTDFSSYIECIDGAGMGFSYFSSNSAPSDISDLGRNAAKLARDMKGAKKPESGKHKIVVQVEAIDNLLEVLLPSFSGDWQRRGITKLINNKKFFSDNLTISEDALSPGADAQPFDDEGTPSQKRTLIEKGIVKNFFYDRETAALASKPNGGSCGRSNYAAPPSIKHSNIALSPGSWNSLDELENYMEIHSMHGSHTANVTTGDAGFEVSAGFLVKKGKRIPVRGFMLTCNVFDLFADVYAIEKKTKIFGNLIAPRIAFDNVQVVS